ncbi:MAG: hypothetical protein HOA52_03485 [Flavobacteriales bacterium]|jgi:hypothetical protein|nr:hypothetical protein [Flavobacteriales bacterium]
MNKKDMEKEAELKTMSRKIVKEILDFGITESQKIDIAYFLSMEIENNTTSQEITKFLKKFRVKFNTEEEDNKIETKPNKIIIT